MILLALVAWPVGVLARKVAEWRMRYWRGQLHATIVRGYQIQREAAERGIVLSPDHAESLREAEKVFLASVDPEGER